MRAAYAGLPAEERQRLLVIDNRATMHRAHGDYDRTESRVLWRIIVKGDRPRLVP
jgi:alpha-ketoglutarate-dependent taurine dioxygenase